MQNRIEAFEQMRISDPENTMILFGLANEYQKISNTEKTIEMLEEYLSKADDEGAAFGMLARAYITKGEPEKAKTAYEKGIETALRHGHPSMANEFKMALDLDF